jgi:hypothetical protein
MTAMSNYLENKLIDHLLRTSAFSAPTNVYVGLVGKYDAAQLEAGTLTHEFSGGAYARSSGIKGDAYWSAGGTSGLTDNDQNVEFTAASNEWGHVSGLFVSDAASGGNVLLYGALTAVKFVENGDQFIISAGDFDITFA